MKSEQNQQQHAAILSLGSAVPQYRMEQMHLCSWMIESLQASPPLTNWLTRLYERSGIETRYACIPDGLLPAAEARFAPGHPDTPDTAERMAIYERESVGLGTTAARRALEDYRDASLPELADVAASVTHLVVVSCTGFFAPGLDLMIARQLELRPEVERTLVGFMGCAAAFNGLRLANHIVQANPSARVLVVCVEICSIHLQPGQRRVDMVVGSLFSDGAAACLVGMPQPEQRDIFEIANFYTSVKPHTEADMVWQIGNYGFVLNISPQVPAELAQVAPQGVRSVTGSHTLPRFWGIHPGGRGIVDRLAEIFHLSDAQLEPSRAVLRNYGNMSSPTILFVLEALRCSLRRQGIALDTLDNGTDLLDGVIMAFGPGLVTEMAYLFYLPAFPASSLLDAHREGEMHAESY